MEVVTVDRDAYHQPSAHGRENSSSHTLTPQEAQRGDFSAERDLELTRVRAEPNAAIAAIHKVPLHLVSCPHHSQPLSLTHSISPVTCSSIPSEAGQLAAMPTSSSGYATPQETPGGREPAVPNGETQAAGSDPPPQQQPGAEAIDQALGQALSDVLESFMAGIPASAAGREGAGAGYAEGAGGGAEDDTGMDVDSPLTDLESPVAQAGPGPSTAASWAKTNGIGSNDVAQIACEADDSLDLNGLLGHADGAFEDAEELKDEREDESGEDELDSGLEELGDDSEYQLDEVLEEDKMLYDTLVYDLKECINEVAWTFYLWKDVFTEEVSLIRCVLLASNLFQC